MMPLALGVWWIRGWWCMGQRMCALWTGRWCLTMSGEWGVKLLEAWLIFFSVAHTMMAAYGIAESGGSDQDDLQRPTLWQLYNRLGHTVGFFKRWE
jgi:hypothetical protein